MSLQSELEKLGKAVENLKKEVRRALLRQLGVDKLVRQAFEEGWKMHGDSDGFLCAKAGNISQGKLDRLIQSTRCWRSVDEAFANSDVEEEV